MRTGFLMSAARFTENSAQGTKWGSKQWMENIAQKYNEFLQVNGEPGILMVRESCNITW